MNDQGASSFFRLRKPYRVLEDANDLLDLVNYQSDTGVIESIVYEPTELCSATQPEKWRFSGLKFVNSSFSSTHLLFLDFTNCVFEDCLFVGSAIEKCTFSGCTFSNCNFFECHIENCYVDPDSFEGCIDRHEYPNIGASLYRELMQSSKQIGEPEFTRKAQYHFMKWTRYEKKKTAKEKGNGILNRVWANVQTLPSWFLDVTTGYGMRLRRVIGTSFWSFVLISLLNYFFRSAFGLTLDDSPIKGLIEAFYFTAIVITSLGFGDITPATPLGQAVVSLEAVGGFFMFAVFASMLYRRIAG